ncbi:hypothetical protein [Roseomonas elaeocarpi]|uniref:Uncharacterized protein n=1 Tax=Roseomonas elaeocarpi TaxID=907779 RepID=A0ABV6JZ29_9PROT
MPDDTPKPITFAIIDVASGKQVGEQTCDANLAPVLLDGQRAEVLTPKAAAKAPAPTPEASGS